MQQVGGMRVVFKADQRRLKGAERTIEQGRRIIGHDRMGEAGRIAIGIDDEAVALRGKAGDHMVDQRPAIERDQRLVDAAHAPPLTARKDDGEHDHDGGVQPVR